MAEDTAKIESAIAVGQARQNMVALVTPSERVQTVMGAVTEAGPAVEKAKGVMDTWNPLLKRISQFVDITDKITDVNDFGHLEKMK